MWYNPINHNPIPTRRGQMNEKQEIRAKALELAIATLALIPDEKRQEQLVSWQQQGAGPYEAVINGSKIFADFITGQ
jgi:hypothetical protein